MLLQGDWNKTYNTEEELKADMPELGFTQEGWYHSSYGSTALVVQHNSKWSIFVWNYEDPRLRLRELLTLPDFQSPEPS